MKFSVGKLQTGRTTILPVFKGQRFEALGLNLQDYHGKRKDHVVWFDQAGTRYVVVGLGDTSKFNLNKLRDAAAFGVRAATKENIAAVTFVLPEGTAYSNEVLAQTAVEGFALGSYTFDKYKKEKEQNTVEDVTLAVATGDLNVSEEVLKKGQIYAEGTRIARDLKNEPANKLRPYDLVDYVQNLFKGTAAQVEVFKGDDLVKNDFQGLLSVGKGSIHPPALVKVSYVTDASQPLTALVGKGLTYDAGGISLKSGRDLSDMRMDMGGAAAVIGALYILTQLQAKVNVVVLIATAENLPDAGSMLPGDLIEYPNGVTVQVANTDAEGRLVLADALILSQKLGAERVVDIATLTGACYAALGTKMAGVWGESSVVQGLKQSADTTGEKIWEMPLEDDYEELLYSAYADVKNISVVPYAGAITAALFLRRFVGENQKWAHLDIAGPMEVQKAHSFGNEGATGFGARLLADWVLQ